MRSLLALWARLRPVAKLPSRFSSSIVSSHLYQPLFFECVKVLVPLKHQLCLFCTLSDFLLKSHHLLIFFTTSISFPDSPLRLYQITFSSTQPTKFCCIGAKCWVGISSHKPARCRCTSFNSHLGGSGPSCNTGSVIKELTHQVSVISSY